MEQPKRSQETFQQISKAVISGIHLFLQGVNFRMGKSYIKRKQVDLGGKYIWMLQNINEVHPSEVLGFALIIDPQYLEFLA